MRLYHAIAVTGPSGPKAWYRPEMQTRRGFPQRCTVYQPLGKGSFGTTPMGKPRVASPRGGLVGCNKRWYGGDSPRMPSTREGHPSDREAPWQPNKILTQRNDPVNLGYPGGLA